MKKSRKSLSGKLFSALFEFLAFCLLLSSLVFAGSFAGHAADDSGFLAGAQASFTHLETGVQYAALAPTDANGFFNITGLPDGNYNLTIIAVSHDDYVKAFFGASGQPFVNNSNSRRTDLYVKDAYPFVLARVPSASLQGTVAGESGVPVSNAHVELYSGGLLKAAVFSGVDGSYSFADLREPSYDVRVVPLASTDYLILETTVSLTFGGVNTVDFVLRERASGGTINGTVYGNGTVLNGAVVEARQDGVLKAQAVAVDGSYSLTLDPGVYSLTASHDNFTSSTVTGVGVNSVVDFDLAPSSEPVAVIVGLLVSPETVGLAVGASQSFVAVVVYSNGSSEVVSPVWSVEGGVGGVDSSGLFTSSSVGSGRVVASFGNYSNFSSVVVVPVPVAVVGLLVSPETVELTVGASQSFVAVVVYSNGSSEVVSPVWSVEGGVGTVGGDGVFSASAVGDGRVVASFSGYSNSSAVTVVQPPANVVGLIVSPASVSGLEAGRTQEFTATAIYSNGSTSIVSAGWIVEGGVGTIGSDGVFNASVAGSGRVVASFANYSNSSTVTIVHGAVSRYAIDPSEFSVMLTRTRGLKANAFDSFGNLIEVVNNSQLVWSVSNDRGVVDEQGVFIPSSTGSTTVTVSNKNNASLTALAQIRVIPGQTTGGGSSGGSGGSSGGAGARDKSRLGEPCSATSDCLSGQCIGGFCALPASTPSVQPSANVSASSSLANATPASSPVANATLISSKSKVGINVPDNIEVGSIVLLEVLKNGSPVENAVVKITRPDNATFTVETKKNGRAIFTASLEGVYSYAVEGFELESPSATTANSKIPYVPPANASLEAANATIAPPGFASMVAAAAGSSVSSVKAFVSGLPSWVLGALVILLVLIAVIVYTMFFGREDEAEPLEAEPSAITPGEDTSGEQTKLHEYGALNETERQAEFGVQEKSDKEKTGAREKPGFEAKGISVASAKKDEDLDDLMKTLELQLERLRKKKEKEKMH